MSDAASLTPPIAHGPRSTDDCPVPTDRRSGDTGADPAALADPEALADLVAAGGVVALTGAGISTESGIPDYRGPNGAYSRGHKPMTLQDFTRDPEARRRYWARSFVGWRRFAAAQPNDGHRALAELEQRGLLEGVITQNVDGLHQRAGSRRVIDLHGRLEQIRCLACESRFPRDAVHAQLREANPGWQPSAVHANPDGDVELRDSDLVGFEGVDCARCSGPLKPDVVYFGESVPPERVAEATAMVLAASALLVLGTSLSVYSGRRFTRAAASAGIPVAVVNQGPTRADEEATIKLDAPLGPVLSALLATVDTSRSRHRSPA
ncbi:MAG: NAD-dependent protein deacetylase [Actinobacteria bacterium]|nr:MAG: NAD-dependent protein deacetylase [Actinomycetota bacterium]